MPKAEWGTKRVCPTTGKRFYDLNRSPIVSPYTGEVVDIESARRKMAAAVISRVKPEKDDDAVLVDDLDADDDLLVADVQTTPMSMMICWKMTATTRFRWTIWPMWPATTKTSEDFVRARILVHFPLAPPRAMT